MEMKAKFILAVVSNQLEVRNTKKKLLCQLLVKEGYTKFSDFTKVKTTKKMPAEKKSKDDGEDA